jgi:hypothetical protein
VAVEELSAKGLLDEGGMKEKLQTMKKQANNNQANLEELIPALESEGLSSENIQNAARETEHKAAEMMKTYLGEVPDSSEALDFLGLAEGGEVIHYEALNEMTKGIKNLQATDRVQSVLEEEKKYEAEDNIGSNYDK